MQKTSLLLCLILIVTFFIFFQTHSFEFLTWDDDKQVTENQYIKKFDSETFKNLYEFDKHTSVSLLTFAVEYQFWGLSSKHMHLNNVLLHLLNIFLIFIFLKLLFGNNFIALFAALLFALHPSRVESVAWISERKDLFYTFWSLLSLIFYTHFLQGKDKHWIVFIVITFASLSVLSIIQ